MGYCSSFPQSLPLQPEIYYSVILKFLSVRQAATAMLLFMSAGSAAIAQTYCTPSVQMACFYGDKIVQVTFAGINHTDDVCTTDSEGKKDFTTTVAPAQVTAGNSYNLSVGVENNSSTGTERVRAWIDFNHNYLFEAGESFDLGIGTGNTVLSATIAVPANAVIGTTAMRVMYRRTSANQLNATDACHSYGSYRGQMKDYAVTINSSNSCTAALTPGNTISTLSAACPNENFTLSLQNTVSGPTYQWQISSNGTNWTNIVGATNSTLTTSQVTAHYYKCVVECQGNFGNSTAVLINSNGPVYTTLPVQESFEAWINSCGLTTNVPGTSWLATPASGNNSFRREDQGASANWQLISSGTYTPAATHGSHSARFHTANTGTNITGSLDLYVDCSTGSVNKSLTFDYINLSGQDVLTIQISTDGGANFSNLGANLATTGGWQSQTRNFVSTSATTVIRFLATSDYQLTDIGIDNVNLQTVVVCNQPTNVAVSGLTTTNATVSWSAPNPAPLNGYEYVLSTVNTVPVSAGTSHLALSKQFFNLIPNTMYYFFIRPVCENGIFGNWQLVSFKTLPTSTASVEEVNEVELSVYPNPVADVLTIRAGDETVLESLRVVDLLGKTVFEKTLHHSAAEISLQDLPNGTYYLTIQTNRGSKNLPVTLMNQSH